MMMKNETIEIPLSKKKMILTLFGSVIFVIAGIVFLINPPKTDHPIFGNRTLIDIAGLSAIIFFGVVAIIILKKISDKKAGLLINREGITDNSSGVSAGLIPWEDIEEIRISQVMNQKFLMIITKNPQDYIDRATNPVKRKMMQINYQSYGSPISISSNSLHTNFEDLSKLLQEKLKEYS